MKCWICRDENLTECTDINIINNVINSNIQNLVMQCPLCLEDKTSNNMFFTNCKHFGCLDCVDEMNLRHRKKRKLRRTMSIHENYLNF